MRLSGCQKRIASCWEMLMLIGMEESEIIAKLCVVKICLY